MREWLAASEVAGLPAVPRTKSGVIRRAREDGWQSRSRATRGGGREYHVGSLPAEARAALLLRDKRQASSHAQAADDAARESELWAAYERKPDRMKAEATRRLNALLAVEQLVREGCQRLEAYTIVATQLGESESTIRNWLRLVKGEPQRVWAPLLVPKWVGRTALLDYDQRVYAMFRDLYLDGSRPPARTCYNRVARWAAAQVPPVTMPSYATLCREVRRREDPAVVLLEREGERKLQESFPYLERSREGLRAMQLVNADGHDLDLAVVWPDGERTRAVLMTVQDIHSSKIVGYGLLKSETAYGMSLTFLDTFSQWGLPEQLYIDNTLAAASKRMTAGAPGRKRFRDRAGDPLGVMPLLEVKVHFVTPAHGQAKPIERSFRSLADLISKHPAFAGAYLGNNPLNKPANYGERVITLAELEPVVANEVAVYNATIGRRTETAGGVRSYDDVFGESYNAHAHLIRRLTPAQQRLLYSVAERVTVDRRDGCVKLFKNRYWSEALSHLKGKQVVLRYHPRETLHGSVWVYRLDGTLVGEAPVYAKAGFADAAAAERHTRARKQFMRKKKDLAKAQRRLEAAEVEALVPRMPPEIGPGVAAARRVDFTLPTTPEQLGARGANRREARARVAAAVGRLADTVLEPKRKRA